ncbi:MAG: AAA family ATPase [Treponema sp.]|nr:AAA family ATPase [Treponema sp.]
MFLKYLDIFGFKSFADRTHFEFSEGITALLGPNGCGKSNVVDAIKWVLGEQSAKSMRAEKREDIIFNGTEKRPALNVAEVALTISNEKNLLPLDVSEITIKRRLFRSGESEYFINNVPARLKEVQQMFWDTGVGKAAYSVMEQGKIDQVLSSKPEDRRYLFEEAAGITRFKVKRAEAENKLLRTEENMQQIEGILEEVKRSYETLKVQSEKTEKYRTLKDEIFYYELDIQLLNLKNLSQDCQKYKNDFENISQKRNDLRAKIDDINTLLAEHMDEVNEMQNSINELNSNALALQIEKNEKEKLAKVLVERKNESKHNLSVLESKKSTIKNQIDSLQEDVDEQESVVYDRTKRLEESQQNIVSFEENISKAGERITENDNMAAKYEAEITKLDSERLNLEKELEAVTEDIVTELDSRLKDVGYSSQAHEEAKEKVDKLVAQLKVLAQGRKNIFSDFASIENHSNAEVKKFANNAVVAFEETVSLAEKLAEAVDAWAKTSPAFIDEFLSPEGIITKKRRVDQKISENKNKVIQKRESINSLNSENSDLVKKIEEYRKTLEDLRINQAQMKAQVQAAEDQLRFIRRELNSKQTELHNIENELFNEQKRLEDVSEQVCDIESEIASIEHRGQALIKQIDVLEKDRENRSTDVSSRQKELKNKNEELSKVQIQLEKLSLEVATSETKIQNIKENFRETHARDLMEFEERMYTILAPVAVLREKLSSTRLHLKELGSVNFMAVEEFAEAKERFEFLSSQLADLQKARDDLRRITEEIRAEATEMFLSTYNKIKKNFHNMFRRLFGGGRAELRLTDPQNVLESGIDILAQPPGKKLENIALRSGGEKTMTAVALLFATYMVRPSPFCLLDEIDAALDENNVIRFVQTLREFANVSQYIIITHNKKTVTGANTLLGITMEESGVTKSVTIKLENESGVVNLAKDETMEPFEEEDVPPEENVYIPPHPPKRNKEEVEK